MLTYSAHVAIVPMTSQAVVAVHQGRPYSPGPDGRDQLGEDIAAFNKAVRADDRVEVIACPMRDGVSIIMRK